VGGFGDDAGYVGRFAASNAVWFCAEPGKRTGFSRFLWFVFVLSLAGLALGGEFCINL
jgi:hypothetical protein